MIAFRKEAPHQNILIFLLMFFSVACANTGKKSGSPTAFFQNFISKKKPVVTGIRMRPADEASRVEIAASGPFKYISYRFHNPERLVIEMKNIDNSIIGNILLKEDAMVEKIEMVNFKKSDKVRAVIYLKEPFAYDLDMKGDVLKVAIMPDESEVIQAYRSKLESANRKIAWLEMELKRYKEKEQGENRDLVKTVVTPEPDIINQEEGLADKEELSGPDDISAQVMANDDLEALKQGGENQAETRPVEVTVKTSQVENQEELLSGARETIEGWLDAWSKKDIKAYGSYYDSSFEGNGQTKEAWLKEKNIKFKKAGRISVLANKVDIEMVGDRVRVTFIQSYNAVNFKDEGVKIIDLVNNGDEWKIVSEFWRPIK